MIKVKTNLIRQKQHTLSQKEVLIYAQYNKENHMNKKNAIKWLSEPASKDYSAAEAYLQLLYEPKKARLWTKKLKRAEMSQYAAKDLLRASGTSIAEIRAYDWTKQQQEIEQGTSLSPILVVRQENGGHLVVADGFHRLCAVFTADEQVAVPCKIV
ncbi:MAG: hypothetical protein ACXU8A_15515 [Burkholderiaceae bacterium]